MRTSGWTAAVMALQSAVTSSDREGLAGEPCGVRRREENGCRGDVLGLANSSQRRLRLDLFAHVALSDAGGVDTLRLHHAGIDGVDPNSARPQFLGQRTGDGIDGA